MATFDWVGGTGTWTTAADWSTGTVPGPGDDAVLSGTAPYTVYVTTAIAVGSITLSERFAALESQGAIVSVGGAITNGGVLEVDAVPGEGGSSVVVAGNLANTGDVTIGNSAASAATEMTVGGLTNSGNMFLDGGTQRAVLDVNTVAGFGTVGVLTGRVGVVGSALIDFASGSINSIAPAGFLGIKGPDAFVATGGLTAANSALTGLTENDGTITLYGGASLNLAAGADLRNAAGAEFSLDGFRYQGGGRVDIAGGLKNYGILQIGNDELSAPTSLSAAGLLNTGTIVVDGGGTSTAMLSVAAPAGFGTAGVVTGVVELYHDSLLDFASGSITSIGSGSELAITGGAFLAVGSATTTNSALTELSSNAGALVLLNGASIDTADDFANTGIVSADASTLAISGTLSNTGALYMSNDSSAVVTAAAIANTGAIIEDSYSVLITTGALRNSGRLIIGGRSAASATVAGLDNQGTIMVDGGHSASGPPAELDVAAGAGFGTIGMVTGSVSLVGNALVKFTGGLITGIAAGGELSIYGGAAAIVAAGSNALSDLSNNDGTLLLGGSYGPLGEAVLSLAPGVDLTNGRNAELAVRSGSILAVSDGLRNYGVISIGGNVGTSLPATVTAAGLVNSGEIVLSGGTAHPTLLDVNAVAGFGTAGVVTGTIAAADATIAFAGGSMTSIAENASLTLKGAAAHILVGSPTVANDGLAQLSSNAGTFALTDGATVAPMGDLANAGFIQIDQGITERSSTLAVGGMLANSGAILIGSRTNTVSSLVTAAGLENTGIIALGALGGSYRQASLVVADTAVNSGTMEVSQGTIDIAGAVSGDGTILLGGADLVNDTDVEFGAAVAAGQTIRFEGSRQLSLVDAAYGTLKLDDPNSFAGTIAGMQSGDTIDVGGAVATDAEYAGGVLTLDNGSTPLVSLSVSTAYADNVFVLNPDGSGGTDVSVIRPVTLDLDGKGSSDMLWAKSDGSLLLWRMYSTQITSQSTLGPFPSVTVEGSGYFDESGRSGVVVEDTAGHFFIAHDPSDAPVLEAVQGAPTPYPYPNPSWRVVGTGDFAGTGHDGLVLQDTNSNDPDYGGIQVWVMDGANVVASSPIVNYGPDWHIVGVGDVNGDGTSDILAQYTGPPVGSLETGDVWVALMNGTNFLSPPGMPVPVSLPDGQALHPGQNWRVVATGDFNLDGTSDILTQYENPVNASDPLNGEVAIALMHGTTATPYLIGNPGPGWIAAGTAEFTTFKNADITFQNSTGNQALIWLMSGTTIEGTVTLSSDFGSGWVLERG